MSSQKRAWVAATLDTKLDVPQGTPQEAANTRNAVVNAMDGHVLGIEIDRR